MPTPLTSPSALYREALQAGIDYAIIPLSGTGLILLKSLARRATIALFAAEGQDAIERLGQEMGQFLRAEERMAQFRRVFLAAPDLVQQRPEEQEQGDK